MSKEFQGRIFDDSEEPKERSSQDATTTTMWQNEKAHIKGHVNEQEFRAHPRKNSHHEFVVMMKNLESLKASMNG